MKNKKKVAIIISPNWKDYALKYLFDCIASIRAQDYEGELRIFLTDNETSPETYQLLRRIAPEAELVLNKGNDGFAKGCNDAIKLAFQQGGFDYFFLVNMDTVLEPDCLRILLEAADDFPRAAIIQPRIMLYADKKKINSLGNETHFLGFGFCRAYGERWSDGQSLRGKKIMYPSGAGALLRASALEEIGLFDEVLWMYNEDQDLGWRSWLLGYENILEPGAVLYHKYEFAKSIKQFYFMDRNRIIEILKNFKLGTLLLILPPFLLMEIGLLLFSLKSGWPKEKLKVWAYFCKISTWHYVLRERKSVQQKRKISDREISRMITGRIWYQELDDWKLRLINPIFALYWTIVRRLIFW
jgi:GT2 family glycosyltransferase